MKKLASIFTIVSLLLFSISPISTMAQSIQKKSFPEGFYSMNDLGLMSNVTYSVENTSQYKTFLVVFDSDQKIQQAISLPPNSGKHPLKAIEHDDRVVILGQGQVIFT